MFLSLEGYIGTLLELEAKTNYRYAKRITPKDKKG